MYEGIEEHRFYGTHAKKADELKSLGFFPRLVDVLIVAPVIGFEYRRMAEKNTQDGAESGMFLAQLKKVDAQLEMNYKTIMLLDVDHEADEEIRLKKAFQTSPENRLPADLERYESYVRGGIDLLHEKLVGSGNTPYERLIELHEFVESFSERYPIDEEE